MLNVRRGDESATVAHQWFTKALQMHTQAQPEGMANPVTALGLKGEQQ